MRLHKIEVKNSKLSGFLSSLIVFFFIGGIVNHALPFAGMVDDGRTSLWHGYNTLIALSGVFSVISAQRLGWYWLVTIFLTQAAVELRGAILLFGKPLFTDQAIETALNLVGISLIWITRNRYRN